MKRYQPVMGILTYKNGSFIKAEDVLAACAKLAGSRATFPLETDEDAAFMEGYRQALDELRLLVEGEV